MKLPINKGLTGWGLMLPLMATLGVISCKKSSTQVSSPYVQVGQTVSPGPVGSAGTITSVKGTLEANKTYNIQGDIMINAGDTLNIQPGAQVIFMGQYNIWVKGNLFSLGSKSAVINITYNGASKQDQPSTPVASDPAYQGLWGGIWCDTSAQNVVLKWTNITFAGAPIANTPPIAGASVGDSYDIFFQNKNGNFIMEDSWLYGATDDAIRFKSGRFSFMRNTLEKGGPTGGDFFNCKGSSVGDCAYNLFIGCATNGPKASNHAQPAGGAQTNCNFYNNTIVNSGYRMVELGRGGSIDYEEGAKGNAYNNLVVNCRFGFRIVGATESYLGNALLVADTTSMKGHYGNQFNYSDSAIGVAEFYPVTPDSSADGTGGVPHAGMWAYPQSTDIPNIVSILPTGFYPGDTYSSIVGQVQTMQQNPKFANFPLPEASTPQNIAYATGFDFHLQSGSPAIGKGFTGFSPLAVVPQGGDFGANETAPGGDIGAYQSNGSGNQH